MGAQFILQICLLVANVKGYMNSSPEGAIFDRSVTGQTRSIQWPSAEPVPVEKEIELLMSGTLLRRGEFGRLVGSRALEVELECCERGFSFHQALSIRNQLMVGKSLKGSWKLKHEGILQSIVEKFEHQQTPLLEISEQYDLPPVSIFRAIVAPRVLDAHPQLSCLHRSRPAGRILQSIISESSQENVKLFLSEWELKELQTAKKHDVIGYQHNCTVAGDWEKTIYAFLDEQRISYLSEDSLKLPGHEAIGTPDCLLVDDLFINGKEIKWIEFKSFYASGLKDNAFFTKKAVSKQVERYQKEFGKHGAVILKNGFSDRISRRYPSTLFLDGTPLVNHNEI